MLDFNHRSVDLSPLRSGQSIHKFHEPWVFIQCQLFFDKVLKFLGCFIRGGESLIESDNGFGFDQPGLVASAYNTDLPYSRVLHQAKLYL